MAKDRYDIIIIGGGPAGLTAGLYAQRAQTKTLLIEKASPGGQVLFTESIENYPGFPEGITGCELMEKMKDQVLRIGLEVAEDEITDIRTEENDKEGRIFHVTSKDGKKYSAISLIIATGATWKHLRVPGEEEFRGKGVSYCATCDAPLFKNKKIVVVGGGNRAVEEAIYLTRFTNDVTLVHRRDRLRAAKILQDAIKKNGKVKLCLDSVVTSIEGDKVVHGVRIKNVKTGQERKIDCLGVFIFVGIEPNSSFVNGKLKLDEKGYIMADNSMQTSIEGIFACGDVREKTAQQIVIAAGEGAQAALSAEKYADRVKGTAY